MATQSSASLSASILSPFGVDSAQMPQNLQLELEDMVAYPTWKEMLFELVYSESLDPWNIDIERLCNAYVEKVQRMKKVSLHVPANVILAASILLRMKSDMFRIEEEVPAAEETLAAEEPFSQLEIPALSLAGRIAPRRMVTLEELTAALETVFARQRERQERIAQKIAEPQIDFKLELSEFDIERAMEELYRKVKKVADSERMALFSAVTAKETAEKLIFSFVALLHLAQKGRLHIFQEKFFGEIFIRMPQEIKSTVRAVSHGS